MAARAAVSAGRWWDWSGRSCFAAPSPAHSSEQLAPTVEIRVDLMTTEENNSRLETERADARQDLQDTLSEVNAKLSNAEDGLRPDRLVESHPVGAALIAGALGFVFGSTSTNRVSGPMIIAALVGFALSKRFGAPEDDEGTGR